MHNDGIEFVYGHDKEVCEWASKIIGASYYGYLAVGMQRHGELIAACVYDRFTPQECSMHIASKEGTRWSSREAIQRAFHFPFVHLNKNRITGETPVWNTAAQKFNEHIGFVREGLKRCAADDGSDAILYGMLRNECRWL